MIHIFKAITFCVESPIVIFILFLFLLLFFFFFLGGGQTVWEIIYIYKVPLQPIS